MVIYEPIIIQHSEQTLCFQQARVHITLDVDVDVEYPGITNILTHICLIEIDLK